MCVLNFVIFGLVKDDVVFLLCSLITQFVLFIFIHTKLKTTDEGILVKVNAEVSSVPILGKLEQFHTLMS